MVSVDEGGNVERGLGVEGFGGLIVAPTAAAVSTSEQQEVTDTRCSSKVRVRGDGASSPRAAQVIGSEPAANVSGAQVRLPLPISSPSVGRHVGHPGFYNMSAEPQPPSEAAPVNKPAAPSSIMHCPISHAHRQDFAKLMKECKEESFWQRALPFSLGSMLVTQGLVYKGYLSSNKRFGALPKVALAGVLGFIIGKISYARACQRKFEKTGMENMFDAGFIPAFGGSFGPPFGKQKHHKHCHHTCEECKAKSANNQSQNTNPSA
ncbi:OCIA domain-containing protein 2 [Pelodytes ibericus]